jgi:hypothetical protein
MKSYIDARRVRRRARGAAMLEGVIVVVFLVGVFSGLVFIAGLYGTKLRTAHEARYRNTMNATNDCKPEGASIGWPMEAPPNGHSDEVEDAVRSMIDVQRLVVEGGGLSRVATQGRFSFGATPDPRHPERPPPLSRTVSWRSTTACNPAVVSLNPLNLLDKLGLKEEIAGAMAGGF